eukprot:TRINITY_DN2308_c0_g1_i2.p2 TRINITY_DN2308_c0_g1~~TRINITY_DN2308_c0_g1_i2.p2  ORF type:complete len:296 (+),score=54.32 TRINITY_DN2308_c0_g1_i2:127-1014(+)
MTIVDYRGFLGHDLQGGCQGLPCVRKKNRPRPTAKSAAVLEQAKGVFGTWLMRERTAERNIQKGDREGRDGLISASTVAWEKEQHALDPMINPSLPLESVKKLPTVRPQSAQARREAEVPTEEMEKTPFAGSRNMPWAVARPRSAAAMLQRGAVDRAMLSVPPVTMWDFKKQYNPHRHEFEKKETPVDTRVRVMRVLRRYPLVDIYDLLGCSPKYWKEISRDLGGLSHGIAVKVALEHVEKEFSPMDRAAFWTAVGTRQQVIDQGRVASFPGPSVRGHSAPATPSGQRRPPSRRF